ncbi:uncharacterized protein LOC111276227 [Durio zibethinus]|uniref:RING-type E3 ubiquitin transferase n=1 Tax=Durio zibethinus TaxID=66656 RepID=A0A6P5WPE3_DURZI|nr:uncharacterized protein LOC111276227 [Durio zibethinus]
MTVVKYQPLNNGIYGVWSKYGNKIENLKSEQFRKFISDMYHNFIYTSKTDCSFFEITRAMKPSMMLWLFTLKIFLLCICFSVKPVSSAIDSYSDHCSLIVPASVPNSESPSYEFGPFGHYQSGFYNSDGIRIVSANITRYTNSFSFYTSVVSKTDKDGVFMVEGSLEFQSPFHVGSISNGSGTSKNSILTSRRPVAADFRNPFYLKLHGFWSESSGKLCMVGTGSAYLKEGNLLSPAAVLKLQNIKNSSSITTLITGTLESLSPSSDKSYFEPISVFMLPHLNYKLSFVSGDSMGEFSGESDAKKNLPIFNVLRGSAFCSQFSSLAKVFHLQYTGCSSKKNCLPFDGVVRNLPGSGYLDIINCTDVPKRVRIILKFQDNSNFRFYQPFNPNTTLIGEGMWDDKKNQLCVFLCRFLDITDSWSNAHVGDCTTRLSLRFPAIWSIKETSSIMGKIWTNKTVNDSGYFDRIVLRSTKNSVEALHGLKYEYTETDRVRNLCPVKKLDRNKRQRYPSPDSSDMKFDMSVRNSEGKTGWGSAVALTVGNQFYKQSSQVVAINVLEFSSIRPTRWESQGQTNISYEIDIRLYTPPKLTAGGYLSMLHDEKVEITAEGIYDADTGGLCMVGCRKLASINQVPENASLDCEILLNFQLVPVKQFENGGYIRGRIESTRKTYDPLYFDHLDVTSVAYIGEQARHSIWTMDLEIAMVLISQTLKCLFVRYQLYHVKRHMETLPFISIVMLVFLTMGQMIPLVLNYEALFSQKHDQDTVLFQTGGWIEVNEVIVRIISMVALLLLLRILQLAFSGRSNDGNQKGLWFAEKMTLLVTASLYASGAFIVMLVDRGNYRREVVLLPTRPVDYWQRSTWDDLKSYAGLISDSFLLPQILLNMFSNSRKNALSPSFYIGMSLVRLLPHVYDLYCDHGYVQYEGTYIYENPAEDFFSTAWDVIISLGVLLFTAIMYLQQRFGGRCILPRRFRGLEGFEKIPVVSES